MSSLARYLDILRQTGADEVRLAPGEPISVIMAGRAPSQGGNPVSPKLVAATLEEVMPADQLREVTAHSPRIVSHEHAGATFTIEVSRRGADLVLSLRPAARSGRSTPPGTRAAEGGARAWQGSRATPRESVERREPVATRPPVERPSEPAVRTPSEPPVRAPIEPPVRAPIEPPVRAPIDPPSSAIGGGSPGASSFAMPAAAPPAFAPVPPAAPPAFVPAPAAPPPAFTPTPVKSTPAATPAFATAPTAASLRVGPRRIDDLLREMMSRRASDLHLSADNPPILRVDGEIQPMAGRTTLSSDDIFSLVSEVMNDKARQEFESSRDADCAYEIPGLARFRVNVFEDRKGVGAVLRQIPITVIPAEQLGLPKAAIDLCNLSKGLVVVTGPTGSGKSTTLAAMIDHINKNRSDHIITIEDPVEFVHGNIRCLVNQREVGVHTKSFKQALRAALREDPDIVLVGEMRDLETIAIAIETAETGHLVFGTLHTTTATSTVDRIIDQFPADRQAQIRVMLSESLKGVIAQVLCKKIGGGRVAAQEILLGTTAVSSLIREGKTFQLANVMQTSRAMGMTTMNEALFNLVQQNKVEAREAWLKSVDKLGLVGMFKNAGLPTTFS